MKDLCLKNWIALETMVLNENQRQLDKWGIQDHSPEEWLMYVTEEAGETANAIGEFKYRGGLAESVVKEAIQTATLLLKIAEMFAGEPDQPRIAELKARIKELETDNEALEFAYKGL